MSVFEIRQHHLRDSSFHNTVLYGGPDQIGGDVKFIQPSEPIPPRAQLKLHHPMVARGEIDFGGYSVQSYASVSATGITGAFNFAVADVKVTGDISVKGVLYVGRCLRVGGVAVCERLELADGAIVEGTVIQRTPRQSLPIQDIEHSRPIPHVA